MDKKQIVSYLPYSEPFLFVDEIIEITSDSVIGTYIFSPEHSFYKGHFKDNPVTPGVILTECMAQIGVVCLGIYLFLKNQDKTITPKIGLTSTHIDYLKPVFPGEKVTVHSVRKYFRFNKLKCEVLMKDSEGAIVCRGEIAGMILKND